MKKKKINKFYTKYFASFFAHFRFSFIFMSSHENQDLLEKCAKVSN